MSTINGKGIPTDRTPGAVGDIYTNSNTGDKYKCVDIHEIRADVITYYYTWIRVRSNSDTPGYIPLRGVDYWTEEDKAEIKSYVDDAIINGKW